MNIGIIGTGGIANGHVMKWRAAGANVVIAIDVNPEAVATFAQKHTIPDTGTEWKDVLERADVDVVSVCLPHGLHAPAVIAAAKASKHILVEKPMATSLQEVDAMIETAEQAGVVLAVRHNQRYTASRRRIKGLVEAGSLGDLYLVRSVWFQSPGYITARPWYGFKREGHGGVLLGLGIHHLDLFRWIAGPVRSVAAFGNNLVIAPHDMDVEDTAVLIFQFQNGAIGEMLQTNGDVANKHSEEYLEFHGTKGWVSTKGELHGVVPAVYGDEEVHPIDEGEAPETEFAMLLRVIREGGDHLTSGRESRGTVELAVAGYRSMDEGCVISLPLTT